MTNKTEMSLQDLIERCTDYDDMTLEMNPSDRGMLMRHISRLEAAEARIAEQKQQFDLIVNSHANRAEKAEAEIAALQESSLIDKDRLEAELNKHMDDCDELRKELAAIRGAAVPVAYMHHSGQVITREECHDDKIFAICCKVETPLFKHPAPPVVVLPEIEGTTKVVIAFKDKSKNQYMRCHFRHAKGEESFFYDDERIPLALSNDDFEYVLSPFVKSADGEV